jgi:stage IV sporulation protein FB
MLHELAHLLTAYLLKVKIAEVQLWPFGGQAQLEDYLALEPEREILVAISGPLFSLSLAGLSYFTDIFQASSWKMVFVNINLLLGGFNLLPALPLDGGHILQAVLSRPLGYRKANQCMTALGLFLGVGIGAAGIYLGTAGFSSINLILVGAFLFWAAYRERRMLGYAFVRFLVRKKRELAAAGFLPARQLVATAATPVKELLKSAAPANYLVVLIVDEQDRITGMKSEAELIELLLEKGPLVLLGDSLF